jgi:hypothetical protein
MTHLGRLENIDRSGLSGGWPIGAVRDNRNEPLGGEPTSCANTAVRRDDINQATDEGSSQQ